MNFKIKNDNYYGITLVALVITIVVMLILVLVTLSIALGENGIISKSKEATTDQLIAQEKEQIELAVQTAKLDSQDLELTTKNLEDELKNTFGKEYGILTEEEGWNYVGKHETYHISMEGQITVGIQGYNYIIYGNSEGILPEEYQQVEYIESTGEQYIDTKILANKVIGIDLKVSYSGTAEAAFVGSWSSYQGILLGYYQGKYGMATNCSWRYVDIKEDSNWHQYTYRNDSGYMDNKSFNLPPMRDYNYNIFLFRANIFGRSANGVRIASCRIFKEDNKLVRDFIPCYCKEQVIDENGNICSGGTIGMYDTVEEKFYTNQGKGIFLKSKIIGVGDLNNDYTYSIPLKITTSSGEQTVTVTLNSPLRKVGYTADYLDLKNKEVVRYIGEDENILETPIEEEITIEDLPEIKDINSIEVDTSIKPSKII